MACCEEKVAEGITVLTTYGPGGRVELRRFSANLVLSYKVNEAQYQRYIEVGTAPDLRQLDSLVQERLALIEKTRPGADLSESRSRWAKMLQEAPDCLGA